MYAWHLSIISGLRILALSDSWNRTDAPEADVERIRIGRDPDPVRNANVEFSP
jgi:hypothetical protein